MNFKIIKNYINGELIEAHSHASIPVIDPSKGEQYAIAPDSDIVDVDRAIIAAKTAYSSWSNLSIESRNYFLNKIADLIDQKSEELALAESIDNGKPLKLAQIVDIPRAAANMRFFTNAVTQFIGDSFIMDDGSINYTVRDPLGVVSCISPWNLPLYLFTWKIAPALAAGNTVVAKPSEVTPMTAYLFSEICIEAGLPKGVLNIVHGYGHKIGDAMTTSKDIKAISFTGSTKTGGIIAQAAAKHFKKVSLEMGGKNPNIIFADCDFEKMLQTTINSSFSNQGEICMCGSRILIEESIYDKFKSAFIERTKELIVGPPLDSKTKVGAIVSKEHFEKILACIELAKEEGGQILLGGKKIVLNAPFDKGYYIEPTIIENLDQYCRTNQEEIFGPVVTLQSFKSEEEAIKFANATTYGLSASVWTENVNKAHRVSRKLESGIVWINTWMKRDLRTPFGGVKQSGVGREGGNEALRFFTEVKNICIQVNEN